MEKNLLSTSAGGSPSSSSPATPCMTTPTSSGRTTSSSVFTGDQQWRWTEASANIGITIRDGPCAEFYKGLTLKFYEEVQRYEDTIKNNFKAPFYDFCVIHSQHDEDVRTAKEFLRLIEGHGLIGCTLEDIRTGENTLDAASAMVAGSTKVFVLGTPYLNLPTVPKLAYQDLLLQRLGNPQWRLKLIPLYPQLRISKPTSPVSSSCSYSTVRSSDSFSGLQISAVPYLSIFKGVQLGNDIKTMEKVSSAISLDEQMRVRRMRRQAEVNLLNRLKFERKRAYQQIKETITTLMEQYGDQGQLPPFDLDDFTLQLGPLSSVGNGLNADHLVNLMSCMNVSIGPSFNITLPGSYSGDSQL